MARRRDNKAGRVPMPTDQPSDRPEPAKGLGNKSPRKFFAVSGSPRGFVKPAVGSLQELQPATRSICPTRGRRGPRKLEKSPSTGCSTHAVRVCRRARLALVAAADRVAAVGGRGRASGGAD